jgi:hypothetical protein
VHWYIRKYGLNEARKRIQRDYKFYPELRNMLLKDLYGSYGFYPFEQKERSSGK